KNLSSRKGAEIDKIKDVIIKLSNEGLVSDDYIKTTFLSYQKDLYPRLDPKGLTKNIVKLTRDYLDAQIPNLQSYEALADPFPGSAVNRSKEIMKHLNAAKKKTTDPNKLAKIEEEITYHKSLLKFFKDHDIKYVPIPARVWLEHLFDKVPNAPLVMSRYFKKRKTFDMVSLANHLLKEGVIQPQDVDIRNVLLAYANKLGNTYAWSDVFKAMEEEKLMKTNPTAKEKETWYRLPSFIVPELKGKWVHPLPGEFIEKSFTKRIGEAYSIGKVTAYIKMLAFDNPPYMLWYNIKEGAWITLGQSMVDLTTKGSLKGFKNIALAIKDATISIAKHDELYWQFMEGGLQGKPYTPSFEDMKRDIEVLKENSPIRRMIKRVQENLHSPLGLDVIYYPLWHTAWDICDRFPRLVSAHFLNREGFTPHDAAQLAALHHGDYPMVSNDIRRKINKIFFTPIFPITMAKVQIAQVDAMAKMITGAAKTSSEKKKVALLVGSVATMIGLILGQEKLMHRLGFKTDKWGYKYTKIVTDEDTGEEKELVVTVPSPENRWLREYYRWETFPEDVDKMEGFVNRGKWNLHPIWQGVISTLQNRKENGDPIVNIFDKPQKVAMDWTRYTFGKLVKVTRRIDNYNEQEKKKAERLFREDFNDFFFYLIKPTINMYLRATPEETVSWKLQEINQEFSKMLKEEEEVRTREKKAPMSDEEIEIWTQNLMKRIDKILELLPEETIEKDEPLSSVKDDMEDKSLLIDETTKDYPEIKKEEAPEVDDFLKDIDFGGSLNR
ncbi:MAG: hypothetical protein ACTSQA_01390, partial [Candidatus Heimdallarchaeaceae archaeon]